MEIEKSFNEMCSKQLFPELRKIGFKKSKYSFYIIKNDNWGIINFQRSQENDKNLFRFTINLAVVSKRILGFFKNLENNKIPDVWDSQWRVRLGELMPEKKDKWWIINEETNITEFSRLLLSLINEFALPSIFKYISDQSLMDLWLGGKSPSLTEYQRLLNLAVLLKMKGQDDLFKQIVMELEDETRGKPTNYAAKIYIEKLETE
jgi:hypothetical protein